MSPARVQFPTAGFDPACPALTLVLYFPQVFEEKHYYRKEIQIFTQFSPVRTAYAINKKKLNIILEGGIL